MSYEATPALRPDLFAQLAATDPFQSRARRLFERGRVLAVNGNQADLCVGYDAHSNPLELKEVPIVSGYLPCVGDWVAIQYEAGHSGAPWVTGPSMAEDESQDSPGIGVFSVSSAEPPDPQKSTVYFDDARTTWRGWDGSDWVDLSSRLHNALTDLQGGAAEEYYHFSAAEHGALQDLHDGDGMASAWIKRLNFTAIDQSATERTRLFEKDGDFFWAINATYDEQADQWNRIDTTKHAYLIALHSKNDIPTEPIGGIAWWRAAPGVNPIGDWAAVGGWELGFMMTEHRNYVMGGINLEVDGSGSPPYGRLTHIAGNDPAGDHTLIQHNSWYEGADSWGRDNVDDSFACGVDGSGDWFWWHYPSSGSSPWNTADWDEYARMHVSGSLMARLDVFRRTSEANTGQISFLAKHITSGDMADGFGAGYGFAIEDNAAVENIIAAIYAVRDGADSTGKLGFHVASAGALGSRATLDASGNLHLDGDLGAGVASPLARFHAEEESASCQALLIAYSSTASHQGQVTVRRARGTQGDPSAVLSGDNLGIFICHAYSGAAWRTAGYLRLQASENWSESARGTRLSFHLADAGAAYVTELMRLQNDQVLFVPGSAASPAVARLGYLDDGIFWPADGALAIALGGSEVARFAGAKLGIGAAPLANAGDICLRNDGVLAMKETTTPTADANYGKLYTQDDNKLYFQDGAGTEHEIAFV